jgi:hypothetical protein
MNYILRMGIITWWHLFLNTLCRHNWLHQVGREGDHKGTPLRKRPLALATRWGSPRETPAYWPPILSVWSFHFAPEAFEVWFGCVTQTVAGQTVDAA